MADIGSYWHGFTQSRLSRRRLLRTGAAAGAGAVALSLIGCGGGSETKGDASGLLHEPVDTSNKAVKGGIYTIDTRDVASFDTQNGTDATHAMHAYSRLVRMKAFKYPERILPEVLPDAALSWEASPDFLTYTFKVRSGMKLDPRPPTSGRTLNSSDLKFSWERFETTSAFRPNLSAKADPAAPIVGVETPDASTVVMKLAFPYAPLLPMLAYTRHLAIMPVEAGDKYDLRNDMRGSAAWRLKEYVPSSRLVYEKNPDWYDHDKLKLDGVTHVNIAENAAGLAQFRAGNLATYAVQQEDILSTKRDLPHLLMKKKESFELAKQWVRFGYKPGSAFLDERVRRATSMLLDRDLIIETFGNVRQFTDAGLDIEMRWNTAVCSGWNWWLDPKGKDFGPESKVYFYDPAEAKKLVQAAGFANGVNTVINWTPNGYDAAYVREIEVMKAMWEEHGDFKFSVNLPDYRSDWRPQVHYNYDKHDGIAWGGNASQPDFDGSMQAWFRSGKDRSGHVMANGQPDPVLDDFVARQRVETDFNKRTEIFKEFQRYAARTMYVYFGAGAATEFEMAQPWLGNWGVYRTAPGGADSNEIYQYLYIDSSKRA